MSGPHRFAVLAAATLLLYWPGFVTDGAGLLLVTLVYMSQKWRDKRDLTPAPA